MCTSLSHCSTASGGGLEWWSSGRLISGNSWRKCPESRFCLPCYCWAWAASSSCWTSVGCHTMSGQRRCQWCIPATQLEKPWKYSKVKFSSLFNSGIEKLIVSKNWNILFIQENFGFSKKEFLTSVEKKFDILEFWTNIWGREARTRPAPEIGFWFFDFDSKVNL